ncbi:ribosome biogenesis GTPase Der [Candidatus Babeliales bacterium]|nr:ribosome biogenesis GTPase Der [Candidatus Babeliales bacterium]
MKKYNKVVVVGRANVGKSTLFNRLSSDVKSLVLDYVGVTRDFLRDTVSWNNRTFELIDTGGIQLTKSQDPLTEQVRLRALEMLQEAAVVVFVCDAAVGITTEDQAIARVIHKLEKPTLLLLNKCDVKVAQDNLLNFEKLGFKNMIEVSAQHGTGTSLLLDEILDRLPKETAQEEEKPEFNIVLLGKPNVGKSSLMNLLMDEERTLVADIPGTTREAITDKISFYRETIQVTDTAGVRRRRSVDETIEEMMVKSSLQAVRDADVVLLLIDCDETKLSQQELKLASFVFETGKALLLVKNKQDLLDDEKKDLWKFNLEPYEYLLKKLETITVSCKTGHNIGKLLPLITKIWQRYQFHLPMSEITTLFKNTLERTPLIRNTQRLKVYSAKQVAQKPPTIRLNVNNAQWFESSQLSFFENLLRKNYELKSIPVKFIVKQVKPY